MSESNIRRGVAFMGAERVDVVRISFTPTAALINGQLQSEQYALLNQRLDYVDLVGPHASVMLNADPPTVDPWFKDSNGNTIASRWAELMDVTARRAEERGRTVIAAAPFNEPDYSTHQGTMQAFFDVAGELAQKSRFRNVRITGGNTLSADAAAPWYNFLKARLHEGNTHQLNGSFANYAGFFQTVVANGHRAVNDELHNVMEAIVGVEYGMQTGIWWGTAERARGEFVKASDGKRLGYAEHRPNWTAAAVYRAPDGQLQAFAGASERQATDTTYRFVAKDRDVFFDGHGPQREYNIFVPGGTGYWENQPNAEKVVNITWGEDIQPPINGRYILVNRNSQKVLEVADNSTADGANIQQGNFTGAGNQQWNIAPLAPRNGGDYSYFSLKAAHSGKVPDVFDFSLADGGNIAQWSDLNGNNQHWYLEYAGDNWFYVCSRLSAKCLDVEGSNTGHGVNVRQWSRNGGENQQWRLLPVNAPLEFNPPSAPTELAASANATSIRLSWRASPEADVAGYTILRAESTEGPYNTIARNVDATAFVDNSIKPGQAYFYKMRAEDKSLNRSAATAAIQAQASGGRALLAHLRFDGDLSDSSENLHHAAARGTVTFAGGRKGNAIQLNGSDNFLKLSSTLSHQDAITVAAWVYWNGGSAWQRIFDFGNSETENAFLTAAADNGRLRFAINRGEGEQRLNAGTLPTREWTHVAVMLDASGGRLYVNGSLADQSSAITLKLTDFNPVINYIGRSQFPDPLFNGMIDDFRVYNYGLSEAELVEIVGQ